MTNFGDSDLPIFVSDFGKPVVYAGILGKGIIDTNDADVNGAPIHMVDRITQIVVPASTFPTLSREKAITVDGKAMVVRDFMLVNDGAFYNIWAVFP